jgi:dihydroneopterin aldolase
MSAWTGDRIELVGLRVDGHHGVTERERAAAQPFEVDVTLGVALAPAGHADDLSMTIDYAAVYRQVREIVEATSFKLLEALAEAIAAELLSAHPLATDVEVRIRKPNVDLGGPIARAGVAIRRRREPDRR